MSSTQAPGGDPRRWTGALVTVVVLAAGVACSPAMPDPAPPAPTSLQEIKIAGSVVVTAGSSNESAITVPEPIQADWAELGATGSGVELVTVGGDGKTTTVPTDLSGDAVAQVSALTDAMNAADAAVPGRSALAGLEAVSSPAGAPVWVFSPMLDTKAPLSFTQLAFDESPPKVVAAVKKADRLPTLKGRAVTFVVTPVAGEQEELSELQVGYQRAVWEGVAKAAGAKKVTFFEGTQAAPGSGTIPAVPVPKPDDKIDSEQKDAKTSTCTLPSPALFLPDQATLIDKPATLKALKDCVGDLQGSTMITVEGHTAGASGSDNTFAKDLSTRRATEVAALLRELDVPARNITKVVGYGSSQPIVKPSTDPKNRAVVVTFTTNS